jgi:sterol 3beta-glucosyltransferase
MGDVQPLVALAVELRRRSHHPILALSPNFEDRVRSLGLEFVPLGPKLPLDEIRGVINAQIQMGNGRPSDQVRHFLQATLPLLPEIYRTLLRVCQGAEVLIGSPYQLACRMVRENTLIPYVSLHLSQFGDVSGEEVRAVSATMVNLVRAQEGFPPLHDPLGLDGISDSLAICAVSRHLVRRPPRWPAHYRITGFFFLDEDGWEPDAALEKFCSSGEPPVVVSFGSVVHADPEAMTNLIVDAIGKANCRAVIQHGWGGLGKRTLSTSIYATGFVPHSWLFSRAALVVHHGGAGTTAAAFRAGVPTLVVPHTLDQPIWAEFARATGCARTVIPFNQLTAARLGASMRASLAEAGIYRSAKNFAERIRTEEGVATAATLIEGLLSGNTSKSNHAQPDETQAEPVLVRAKEDIHARYA